MINLKLFLKTYDIKFTSEKKSVSWLKSLNPKQIVRVGNSYFVDPEEMEKLFQNHLIRKLEIRQKRSDKAKENFKTGKINKNLNNDKSILKQ